MAALNPPVCDFGWKAPDFSLPATDGRLWTRDQACGERGLLVMFLCNHCPYVQSVLDRILRDARELATEGVGVVAVMSNDVLAYPDDAPGKMRELAERLDFPFPYLYDATQSVARAYGAVCTPDFFGFNSRLELQYRGRLDASGRAPAAADAPRELFSAMCQIARSGQGPREQVASLGCSIKWRP